MVPKMNYSTKQIHVHVHDVSTKGLLQVYQTDTQTDTQTDRHTDRQTHRQTVEWTEFTKTISTTNSPLSSFPV